ncbi:MAG TPA: hypothetical protein VKU61_07710 [Candidatus Binatia bacterium]|nr:hypothetical protein [Candidatus Binatia bacterium]
MGEDRPRPESTDGAEKRAVPSAADSWRRNVEILELVNRIRSERGRRPKRDEHPTPPRPR